MKIFYSLFFVVLLSFGFSVICHAGVEEGLAAAKSGNYAEAQKIWLLDAKKGNADAQNNLGVLYEKGLGVPPDLTKARDWYLKAANGGKACY
jgi:TPR repeat protein